MLVQRDILLGYLLFTALAPGMRLFYNERCSRYTRCGYLQRQDAVMSSTAVNHVLTSIPGLLLEEHHADSLRMMGSLQMLANSTPEDILDNTDLEQSQ